MKIAIIGYSGSGKSTLAGYLGEKYQVSVMYLDSVYWLPGWKSREREEYAGIVKNFLDTNNSWVIDGNYTHAEYDRRMEEADEIIFMNFNRLSCLYRAVKRYFQYRGKSRASMTVGCQEKMDIEFIWWILHAGRTRKTKKHYRDVLQRYKAKVTVIRNQRELAKYMNER